MFPIRLDTAVEGLARDTFLLLARSRLLHVQRLVFGSPAITLDDTWKIEQRSRQFSQPCNNYYWDRRRLLLVILVGSEVQFFSVFDRS